MDCSPPGSSVHGISQARILYWIVISFSQGSSQPKDQTDVSCIGKWIPYHRDTSHLSMVLVFIIKYSYYKIYFPVTHFFSCSHVAFLVALFSLSSRIESLDLQSHSFSYFPYSLKLTSNIHLLSLLSLCGVSVYPYTSRGHSLSASWGPSPAVGVRMPLCRPLAPWT